MDPKFIEIEYIDIRPIIIPRLKRYPDGVGLPKEGGNVIKVTETERRGLMRMRNGNSLCWKDVEKKTPRKTIIEEVEESEE